MLCDIENYRHRSHLQHEILEILILNVKYYAAMCKRQIFSVIFCVKAAADAMGRFR